MFKGRLPGAILGGIASAILGVGIWAFNQRFPVVPPLIADAVLVLCVSAGALLGIVHYYPRDWMFWSRSRHLPRPVSKIDGALFLSCQTRPTGIKFPKSRRLELISCPVGTTGSAST